MKKVQGKKKRDTAARQLEEAAKGAPDQEAIFTADDEATTDLLSSKDDDVIF